ncbi:MAG: hypothetical protein LBJ61_06180 [Deltaproteobacteria bacterium]|jgi:ABC-type multidrug transport system fused ATPase/permease subunit|nr:hypothetical protein [Deltaproteobacteria bacterium]
MASANQTLLSKLFSRLVTSAILSLLGCWGIIVPRLSLFEAYCPYQIPAEYAFYVDVGAFSLALLGLLFFLFYVRALGWRLRRLDDLGEANW